MESLYDTYASTVCRDVPIEYLKQFILGFLYEASKDMGCTFEKETMCERVYYIINLHYNHLPLSLVASAFRRGALGQYGAGRLVPRTVFGWLGEINMYWMNIKDHKDIKIADEEKFKGLEKYPMGKAICWKIDHVKEDWDKVPLKVLAEMIGRKETPTLKDFGIEN